jgi:DNA-binding MarR family transcriptional regulator
VEEIGFATALVRLSHLVQHTFTDVSRDHDLTPQQAQLLCLLIDGPVGMSELGRALRLEKSSLTGLVDRVQRRGLVARVPDENDRRACRIALSPEGARLGREVHENVTAALENLGGELKPEARTDLTSSVVRLLASADPALLRR